MAGRKYVLISTDALPILESVSAEESGHVIRVMYDYWDRLDDVNAEEVFKDEPDLKRVWPELKKLFTYGVEEEGEEDAEPDN